MKYYNIIYTILIVSVGKYYILLFFFIYRICFATFIFTYGIIVKIPNNSYLKEHMKKLDNVEVCICKMSESSGNEQFYVRLHRTDEKAHGSVLEHDCFQTKNLDKKQCLERAWFTASFMARFCGLSSMDEVVLQGFNDEETAIIKKALFMRW